VKAVIPRHLRLGFLRPVARHLPLTPDEFISVPITSITKMTPAGQRRR
jgi:hypothetical protein